MVPLVPGSNVYLFQQQKTANYNRKPTILVRNLTRVFFSAHTLKQANYGGGGTKGYKQLNPAITSAIIGKYIITIISQLVAPVSSSRSHIKVCWARAINKCSYLLSTFNLQHYLDQHVD